MQVISAGYKLPFHGALTPGVAKVVRHQHVRVQRTAKTLRDLDQAIEEELVVLVSEETRLTIVPALNDVHGNTGNLQALTTGHGNLRYSSSIPPQRTAPKTGRQTGCGKPS